MRYTSLILLKLTAHYNGMRFFLDLGALTFAFARQNNIRIDRKQFGIIMHRATNSAKAAVIAIAYAQN